MFKPKTKKIATIFKKRLSQVNYLESKIFRGKTNVYIDWANVFYWQKKLRWHIDVKRLQQFLSSFDQINSTKIYQGYFEGDKNAEKELSGWGRMGLEVRTKPVKEIRLDIDVTPYHSDDTEIINRVVLKPFVKQLPIKSVEVINSEIKELNEKGIKEILTHKCNFDVEMACDMRIDEINDDKIETFVVWSGDSDFIDTVNALIDDGKNVVIFSTRGRVSRELSSSKAYIFDIQRIKDYICWNRERGS